jgi:hypothetical protein
MIALLANPPAPLALRVDLLEFRKPRPPPTFPELILKLHKIIANPASRPEDVKIAKSALLRAIATSKQFSPTGAASRPSLQPKVEPPQFVQGRTPPFAFAKLQKIP